MILSCVGWDIKLYSVLTFVLTGCGDQVKALSGHRVVQVSLGSRDAQTLALTEDGTVYSWGDGDFGKLGRGGSDGCNVPHVIDRLNGLGVCQIECGAQFSLALTKSGQVWTWSVTSSHILDAFGGVAEWLECRSLDGRLSLRCAQSMIDR